MKRILTILAIAATHFAFTKMISTLALSVVAAGVHEARMPVVGRGLMIVSKVLYFPVFTFAWYPRQFFPGNLVYIPLFINSLLWASVIYLLFVVIRKLSVKPVKPEDERNRL